MAFRDIVRAIKPAVVGLGILTDERDPLSFVIMGTGFIVDPANGWIMTNRHVAELFVVDREGIRGVRNALARAILFVDATGRTIGETGKQAVGGYGAAPFPIVEIAMATDAPNEMDVHYDAAPDLALCRISTENVGRVGIENLPSLRLGDSSPVREGDDIGICGFPLGLVCPRPDRIRQLTSIVQRGVIAAVLPWSGIPNPHAFQLDMSINGGSSGSPLFLADTGEVVGVVFAARVQPGDVIVPGPHGQRHVATVSLPTGFGYAVPAQRYMDKPKSAQWLPDVIHKTG